MRRNLGCVAALTVSMMSEQRGEIIPRLGWAPEGHYDRCH